MHISSYATAISRFAMPVEMRGRLRTLIGAGLERRSGLSVGMAVTLNDFMQAERFMGRVAAESCAPFAPGRIGVTLARINYGGSGRGVGAVILARDGDELVGFAVLLAKPDVGMELAWLHADPDAGDRVLERLWQKVVQTQTEWGVPQMNVSMFVAMPKSMRARIAND